jgi:hypothetical protein
MASRIGLLCSGNEWIRRLAIKCQPFSFPASTRVNGLRVKAAKRRTKTGQKKARRGGGLNPYQRRHGGDRNHYSKSFGATQQPPQTFALLLWISHSQRESLVSCGSRAMLFVLCVMREASFAYQAHHKRS